VWADLEVDGRFHAQTANADARRAWGLGLPRLSFTADAIESKDFVAQVAARLTHLEKREDRDQAKRLTRLSKFVPQGGTRQAKVSHPVGQQDYWAAAGDEVTM
jgi:hypothetical protein